MTSSSGAQGKGQSKGAFFSLLLDLLPNVITGAGQFFVSRFKITLIV